MRLFLLFCLSLSLAVSGQAQERVRNVRMRVADSSQLEIRYDLINTRPGDSVYLDVKSRLRGSLRILPEFVRGDVGKRVTAGPDRRIVWSALANGYSLNEEIRATVFVKAGPPAVPQPSPNPEPVATVQTPAKPSPAPEVLAEKPIRSEPVAGQPAPAVSSPTPAPVTDTPAPAAAPPRTGSGEPTGPPAVVKPETPRPNVAPPATTQKKPVPTPVAAPDEVASQKRRYAGPAWALLSAVAPGFGNIFVQTPKPKIGLRPVLAVGCYALLVYGLQERQKSRADYALYEQQKNAEMGDPYYNMANEHHHRYYLATRGAMVVAAADVILTFFKGMRNVQAARKTSLQSVTLRPGLQAGQPTAVVRYSF